MSARTKKSTRPRRDVEAEITAKVIEALEGGTVPWTKPWTAAWGEVPTSVATGRPYRGINALLLWMESTARGYASPYWLTFKQAKERGGSVRKGEHGTTVVFWKRIEVEDKDAVEPGTKKSVFLLRHYTVFNLEQTENVSLPPRFDPPETDETEPIVAPDAIAEIIAEYVDGPSIDLDSHGDSAHYDRLVDRVTIPEIERFSSPSRYAATVLHELVHSTGHESRLNRFERNGEPQHFGSERYAREELVAEMGSAMLAGISGLEVEVEQSAAYIENWLGALRNDQTLIVSAAQQAQKAIDRIIGTTNEGAASAEADAA